MYAESVLNSYEQYEQIIETMSKRFSTYGYNRIKTSAFEQYDLYSKVKSDINQLEMIKVIDCTGEVLVLRPDVTIPLTQQLANTYQQLPSELRYYYVQEVFRQSFDESEPIEKTQAGIEYFCESSPEADAETIALAYHALKDVGFSDLKIEVGHAAFFNELIKDAPLTFQQLTQLKTLIQAKNVVELGPFLQQLPIEEQAEKAIEQLPFLYGQLQDVLDRANQIMLTEQMKEVLAYFNELFRILMLYGLEKHVVVDFGLLNHMDYYSGIIFQGYVGRFGKPVLMGGRYDGLGKEFGADLPAIGFACEVESLVKAKNGRGEHLSNTSDVQIIYEASKIESSIQIANELRESGYRVLSSKWTDRVIQNEETPTIISLNTNEQTVKNGDRKKVFQSMVELLSFLKGDSEWTI